MSGGGVTPRGLRFDAAPRSAAGLPAARSAALAGSLAACVLLAGCPSTPGGDTGEGGDLTVDPAVVPRTGEDGDTEAQAKLSLARAALAGGDPLAAIAAATDGLRAGASDPVEVQLRAVRVQARKQLVEETMVNVSLLPRRDVVADGEDVVLDVVFRNVSSAPVELPASEDGSSNAVVVLDVVREDRDVEGNLRETEFSLRVPLEEDVELAPGTAERLVATVPAVRTRLTHVGYSVLRVGGYLRPVVLRVGGTELFDRMKIDEASVRVLMRGYEQLAGDPLASLASAIKKRSPPHIATAAELLSPDERHVAVRLLDEATENDPPLAFVLEPTAARLRALGAVAPREDDR